MPSRTGSPRGPRAHDGTIIPGAVDVMWGTGLTTTITTQGQAAMFVAGDPHLTECVRIYAALLEFRKTYQHHLADRAKWLQAASRHQAGPASNRGQGRVARNSVYHPPTTVQTRGLPPALRVAASSLDRVAEGRGKKIGCRTCISLTVVSASDQQTTLGHNVGFSFRVWEQ